MKLKADHPAVIGGFSIHHKNVKDAGSYIGNIIKPASNNSKLGKGSNVITKGHWRRMPMYSITLEERATCPATCHRWLDCYGNNMGFAHKFKPGKELENRIWLEVAKLADMHPNGFVIRLHVLGDFYSLEYVQLWRDLLSTFPNLSVFGYTAHGWFTPIGIAIRQLRRDFPGAFQVRHSVAQSNSNGPYAVGDDSPVGIVCPEQVGKTESCLTCGLCWSAMHKTIKFLSHKRKKSHGNQKHSEA